MSSAILQDADLDALLLSPQYVESPYEIFDALREQTPVFWSNKWNAWVLTRPGRLAKHE